MIGNKQNNSNVNVQSAPAVADQANAAGTSKPTHVLKFKGEDGKFVTITGLFESTAKDGSTYLKGRDRESGTTYAVFIKTEKAG